MADQTRCAEIFGFYDLYVYVIRALKGLKCYVLSGPKKYVLHSQKNCYFPSFRFSNSNIAHEQAWMIRTLQHDKGTVLRLMV